MNDRLLDSRVLPEHPSVRQVARIIAVTRGAGM